MPVGQDAKAEDVYDALVAAYGDGATDDLGGGVATDELADRTGLAPSTVRRQLRTLEAESRAEEVRGMGPHGIRPSWLPREADT